MTNPAPAILYMNQSAVLGGAERVLLIGMEQMRLRGARPLLACPGEGKLPEAARAAGFDVFPFPFAWMENKTGPRDVLAYLSSIARLGRAVDRLCREQGVDVVHPISPVAGLYAMRAARTRPMLLHMHDAQPPKRARRMAIRYQGRAVTRFVCVSRCVEQMVHGIGIPPAQTRVLANAIDGGFLASSPAPVPDVAGPGPHIGLVAQIVPWKGQHIFLDAAERLAERVPSARFWVVGTLSHANDQPYLNALQARVARPPLLGRATLTGYQADVRGWMAAMDMVVHTSVEPEAFGLVIAEAMALGKRVIATDTGGPAEIIENNRTGVLLPPNDADVLARAMEDMIRNPDPEMGARAAASVRARYSPERHGADLAALYAETLVSAR